jgi:hypothetical protein
MFEVNLIANSTVISLFTLSDRNNLSSKFDCVRFQSASGGIKVIDTTESGDLEPVVVVREYSKFYDDFLSVSANVHDDGNVLEIARMCSSHRTYVASI